MPETIYLCWTGGKQSRFIKAQSPDEAAKKYAHREGWGLRGSLGLMQTEGRIVLVRPVSSGVTFQYRVMVETDIVYQVKREG